MALAKAASCASATGSSGAASMTAARVAGDSGGQQGVVVFLAIGNRRLTIRRRRHAGQGRPGVVTQARWRRAGVDAGASGRPESQGLLPRLTANGGHVRLSALPLACATALLVAISAVPAAPQQRQMGGIAHLNSLRGRNATYRDDVRNLNDTGMNDRINNSRWHWARWEVCEDRDFPGRSRRFRGTERRLARAWVGRPDRRCRVRGVAAGRRMGGGGARGMHSTQDGTYGDGWLWPVSNRQAASTTPP
jgi:hypothetical protein